MVIEYIRYTVPAARTEEFENAYQAARSALDASEHCRAYDLSRGVEEPGNYILRIVWDSLEGHEQGFRSSPEFGPFFKAVKPFLDQIAEMKHYQPTKIVSRKALA
jgi:quinol monooxygenase YgiN